MKVTKKGNLSERSKSLIEGICPTCGCEAEFYPSEAGGFERFDSGDWCTYIMYVDCPTEEYVGALKVKCAGRIYEKDELDNYNEYCEKGCFKKKEQI
jgi:hypothetical protein